MWLNFPETEPADRHGMEHQQHIHYAMPLRTMIYDSLSYLRQAEEISRRNHREKAWGDRDEFLSGLKKDDRLIPCYTAVLYWERKSGTALGRWRI